MKEFIAGTQRGRKLNILGSLESIKSIESIESMESLESIEMDSRREHAGMTVFRYIVFSKLLTFNFQLSTFFVPALNLFLKLSLIKWETHGDGTINCQLSIINYQLSIINRSFPNCPSKSIIRLFQNFIPVDRLGTHLPLKLCREWKLPTTQYPLPNTHYPIPTTHYPIPTTHYPIPNTQYFLKPYT